MLKYQGYPQVGAWGGKCHADALQSCVSYFLDSVFCRFFSQNLTTSPVVCRSLSTSKTLQLWPWWVHKHGHIITSNQDWRQDFPPHTPKHRHNPTYLKEFLQNTILSLSSIYPNHLHLPRTKMRTVEYEAFLCCCSMSVECPLTLLKYQNPLTVSKKFFFFLAFNF